jgi:hypothetical protein
MRLFRSRKKVAAPKEMCAGKRLSRWKSALAAAAFFAFTAPKISLAKEVSFKSAVKKPELRQQYLDQLHRRWNSECVRNIIYDPSGKRRVRLLQKKFKQMDRKGLGGLISPSDRKTLIRDQQSKNPNALVISFVHEIGDNKKRRIFVLPATFKKSEEALLSTIKVHENTHACDAMRGIVAGGRVYRGQELAGFNSTITVVVQEMRAYGNQLRKVQSLLWMSKKYLREGVMLGFTIMHRTLKYSDFAVKDDLLDKQKSEASLVRATLKEYRDVSEEVAN